MTASDALIITRIFNAPRGLVFKAWTQPELVKRWWGPKGFTTPFCNIDLHIGGIIHNCMRSPEGRDYWSKGIYSTIIESERLVFSDSFSDENGNLVSPTHYGMSVNWPAQTVVSVTFTDHAGKTKLVLEHAGMQVGEERNLCEAGWNESLERLAEELEKLK